MSNRTTSIERIIMEMIITYATYYIIVASIFILINSFISGYVQDIRQKEDFIGSILWPISLANFLGTLTRVVVIYTAKKLKQKVTK